MRPPPALREEQEEEEDQEEEGDGPPHPQQQHYEQGLTLADARRRLAAIVEAWLAQHQREQRRPDLPHRSQRPLSASLHGGVLPPLLALVLIALGRVLSPSARTEDGEWWVFWTTVGALGFCVVLNAWLAGAQRASMDEEVAVRLQRALHRYQRAALEEEGKEEEEEEEEEEEAFAEGREGAVRGRC
jgi:hypothetical protein